MKSKTRFFMVLPSISLLLIGIGCIFLPVGFAGEMSDVQTAVAKVPVVTHYEFGRMEVDGKVYKAPYLFISPDGTISPWRTVSHYIEFEDIEDYIDENTKVLVIGTGDRGGVIVPKETRALIEARSIELKCLKTAPAVDLFNKLPKDGLVGLFHLNC